MSSPSPSISSSKPPPTQREREFYDPIAAQNPIFQVGDMVTCTSTCQLYVVGSIATSTVTSEANGKIGDASGVVYVYGIVPFMPGQKARRNSKFYWQYETNLKLWKVPERVRPRVQEPLSKKVRKGPLPTSHSLGCECTNCAVIEEECVDSEIE